MVRGPGWVGEPYIAVLWRPRCWQDVLKVQVYSPKTLDDVDKKRNQFFSDRHAAKENPGTKYDSYISLLRLPGSERPIGGEYDRESNSAGGFERDEDPEGN